MLRQPLSRRAFEERTQRLIAGDTTLAESELAGWELGRDWLAWRLTQGEVGAARRRSPRLKLSLSGHIAGTGGAFTEDLGFHGLTWDGVDAFVQGFPAAVSAFHAPPPPEVVAMIAADQEHPAACGADGTAASSESGEGIGGQEAGPVWLPQEEIQPRRHRGVKRAPPKRAPLRNVWRPVANPVHPSGGMRRPL